MAEPNFKGLLQIHCQKAKVQLPQYSCTQRMQGSSPVFLAKLSVLGRNFTSEAEFSSKKQAEKSVAKLALRELGILDADIKLKSPDGPVCVQAVNGRSARQEVGQSCAETSAMSTTLAAGESQEGIPTASVSSPEVHENVSTQEQQISSPELHRVFPPTNTQTPVPTRSNNPISHKNVLQEQAQKMGLALPQYETTQEGAGFVCTIAFNGQCFKSEGCSPSKKLAQQNAAAVAVLKVSNSEQGTDGKSPIILESKAPSELPEVTIPTTAATPEMFDSKVSYKNLLQENCQQRGNKPPAYSTTWEGSGFISVVRFGDRTVSSKTLYTSKKQAEQMAAREALLVIGVSNPELVYNNKETKKNKLERKFAPRAGYQRTSWVHFRGEQGQPPSEWGDVDHFWEQAIASKRQKLDPNESPHRTGQFRATTFALPLEHRQDLTVGEIWKEKKNVLIVGDAESSFILYCTRVPGTCNIFNTRTMSLVLLEPGYRIVGLDAQYSDHNGKVALQAERCADVIIPETPDPVLTSCGVVLLFQDPHSSLLQVLLKRYLSSQAFINVVAALAQYFRRRISGRPVWLDIPSLTEHIRDWMLEEVQNIATMNSEALQHVFSYMWKFNKRWCSVLNPPLPHDLESLKARAADELARRQASDVHYSEDFYHPWGLPKGNFKHRMLSTGLFIEPAADCAVRELKEETGIKLDADEVKNCPQIDLLQMDNLNPHKGDMVKFFLYVYSPDSIEDELNTSQELDQLNTSIKCETEKPIDEVEDSFLKSLPLDMSAEQETSEKGENEKNSEDRPEKSNLSERGEELQENSLNMIKSLGANQERSSTEMDQFTSRGIEEGSEKRRGLKRKRDDDDNNDDKEMNSGILHNIHEAQESCSLPGQSSTPNKPNVSLDSVTTPTSGRKQEMITARSPHVQGSVHEECAWFTFDEARFKSPVFEQIHQTQQFRELLNSVLASGER